MTRLGDTEPLDVRQGEGRLVPTSVSGKQGWTLEVEELHVEIAAPRGIVRAVDGASFRVRPGESLGLVGESGCGKSTTLRAILGLLPRLAHVRGGRVLFDGEDLLRVGPKRMREIRGRAIGMIFQDPMTALNPVVAVGEQIAEGPRVRLRMSAGDARKRAVELMSELGIPDAARRSRAYPHELSGGMRQRVMIAIALASRPRLLLCDEPTTALDVTVQDQILRLLRTVRDDLSASVVYVTHDLAVVAQICDRVAVMYAGQVIEDAPVRALFREPRHPYSRGLLESVPDFEQERERLSTIPGSPPDLVVLPSGCRFHPRCGYRQADCDDGLFPLLTVGPDRSSACRYHHLLANATPPLKGDA